MPVAILAFGLLAALVLVILATYGFALWFTLLVAGLASLVLLTINLYLVKGVVVTILGTFPVLLRRGFSSLFGLFAWVLLGATYAIPVVATLLLIGVDVRYFYPPLVRYEAQVASAAERVYGIMGLQPVGKMTLTRLVELVLGAEAAWGAVLLTLVVVFGLLMLLRLYLTGEAAKYIKDSKTEEG